MNKQTILITGCSSGFGLETALYFLERDWKVIATMRTPKQDLFPASDDLKILPLDVTNTASIEAALNEAGPIDVLVNNAGIGIFNALEGTTSEDIQKVFETNTFGPMKMIKAALPQFKEQKKGIIVNISSSVTLRSLPFVSLYSASKVAVNAFTQSLVQELSPFNIRCHLVLPGYAPHTNFSKSAMTQDLKIPNDYAELAERMLKSLSNPNEAYTEAKDVAEKVWRVVQDSSSPLFNPAGPDAVKWAEQYEPYAFS